MGVDRLHVEGVAGVRRQARCRVAGGGGGGGGGRGPVVDGDHIPGDRGVARIIPAQRDAAVLAHDGRRRQAHHLGRRARSRGDGRFRVAIAVDRPHVEGVAGARHQTLLHGVADSGGGAVGGGGDGGVVRAVGAELIVGDRGIVRIIPAQRDVARAAGNSRRGQARRPGGRTRGGANRRRRSAAVVV